MTTLIVNIEDSAEARKIATELRKRAGVAQVKVQQDEIERIPGIPYTREALLEAVRRADEDYAAGRYVTSEELRKKYPRL